MEKILTREFTCIGCQHRNDIENFLDIEEEDICIYLMFDSENEYDKSAIKVMCYDADDNSFHIGFLANDNTIKKFAQEFITTLDSIGDRITEYKTKIGYMKWKNDTILTWFNFTLTVKYT